MEPDYGPKNPQPLLPQLAKWRRSKWVAMFLTFMALIGVKIALPEFSLLKIDLGLGQESAESTMGPDPRALERIGKDLEETLETIESR
jgi:hypothetical protein